MQTLADADQSFPSLGYFRDRFIETVERTLASSDPFALALTDTDVATLFLGTAHLIMALVFGIFVFYRRHRASILFPAILIVYFAARAVAQFLELIPASHPFYTPSRWVDGLTSLIAFALSLTGLLMLRRVIKRPGREELTKLNEKLTAEISSRVAAEQKLSETMSGLELRVAQRTAELEMANAALTAEISERTATAVALKAAKDRAEASNHAKNEFLANMSHEIRTPMTAIVGFSEMLTTMSNTPAERLSYIESIKRNSDGLLKIIDDILDLAKIEAGAIFVERSRTSVVNIIEEIRTMFESSAANRNLTVRFSTKTPVPEFVFSDPARIRQILINLIGNALKFTERGEVHISLRFAENKLFFRVADTGCGIDADHCAKIFKPFMQADASVTKRHGGTGLGLALSRRLAISLGGDLVLANSIVGRGSVFEFHCNTGDVTQEKKIVDLIPLKVPTSIPVKKNAANPDLSGLSILLVEDSHDLQVLTSRILRERGATVSIAHNGAEALEKAWTSAADIILMDIQMPEMDGMTATSKLRASGYQKPVIAMTAYAMEGDRERCLSSGFTDYISKPIRRDSLLRLVEEYRSQKDSSLELHSEFANDPVIGPVISLFIESLPERLKSLGLAISERRRDDVKKMAHQLRGSAGAFGFSSITDAAANLEEVAISDRNWDDVCYFAEGLLALGSQIKSTPAKRNTFKAAEVRSNHDNQEASTW